MSNKIKLYGSIEKVDSQDDGTIIVCGVASTEALDSQGEIVTAAAMKSALPDYMKFGAIREMHQPLAAGTALKCFVDDGGVTHLEAHIVDPVAVSKVNHGVYKGFSIGGKVKSRDEVNKNMITGLRLTEISLVDVPANPEAMLTFGKVADEEDFAKWAGEEIMDARTAIEALQAIFWLLDREMSEAEKSPEQITALKAVVENLKNFIASEIKEDNSNTDIVSMGEKTGDLEKAGAKFSKATKTILGDLHASVKAANDHLTKLGYADDKEQDMTDEKTKADASKEDEEKKEKETKDEEKDPKDKDKDKKKAPPFGGKETKDEEDAEEKDKEKSQDTEDLKKSLTDTVAKAEALETELAKANTKNAELQKQVDELKALPAPPKGSVMAVQKGVDAPNAQTPELEPIRKGDGTIDEVATAIKQTHRSAIAAAR